MKLFSVLALLLCTACIQLGSESQPARYYLLTPLQVTEHQATTNGLALELGPLYFPPYLDRPQLITRNSANEIVVAEFERWAEPLQDNLLRVLKENLSRNLKGVSISEYPWQPTNQESHLALHMTLNQFDGILGQDSIVDIRWSLKNAHQRHEVAGGHFVSRQQIGTSYQELVNSLNQSLNQFSIQVASAVAQHAE